MRHANPDFKDGATIFKRNIALIYLTIKSIVTDKKTQGIFLILLLLLAIPIQWHRDAPSKGNAGMELFLSLIAVLYLQFLILYTSFLYSTALITSEMEDRTMVYLIVRPISRLEVLVSKYLGYVISIFTLFAIPVILNYLILATHEGMGGIIDNLGILAYVLGGVLLGVMMWGALFMLFSSLIKNPIMPGFLFCIFWETLLANMGGSIPKVTVTYYLRTFVVSGVQKARSSLIETDGDMPYGDMSTGLVFVLGMVVSALFIFGAWWQVREKDFY